MYDRAMTTVHVDGCDIAYEVSGSGPPMLMPIGLGGVGRGWGSVVEMLAADFTTIVPDHRGTGASGRPDHGYTIEQHAIDMVAVLDAVGCGPAHIVGSSTGGAIAQQMAVDHGDHVQSIAIVDSWARADDYFTHQFQTRKQLLLETDSRTYAAASALVLFSAEFIRDSMDTVRSWIEISSSKAPEPELFAKRIDMIMAFDVLDRLPEIDVPTLVIVGSGDTCTPPYFSDQLAEQIPGAVLEILDGGHLIYKEAPDAFVSAIRRFALDS